MNEDIKKLRNILSTNIKKYRAEIGLSQEKLAELAALSVQTINDIEGSRTWVSDKTLIKIAKVLKVEVFHLVYPSTEAAKLFPVRIPAEILLELRLNLENDLANRFNNVLTETK